MGAYLSTPEIEVGAVGSCAQGRSGFRKEEAIHGPGKYLFLSQSSQARAFVSDEKQ